MGCINILAANPVEHVIDKPIYGQQYISNVTVMLVLGAIVTAAIVIPAARRIASGKGETIDSLRAKGLWANMVEAVCLYLRDEVYRPVLNEQTDRFTPMLWTFFWFILVCNLLGLVPLADFTAALHLNPAINPETKKAIVEEGHQVYYGIGGTATQSIYVTGALAVVAFLFYNGAALIKNPVGYFKHLTAGAPWFMWVVMIPVEVLGMFVKPFALALRLFANMTGGHIVIAVLLSFVLSLIQSMPRAGYGMALLPIIGATVLNLLEILVCFIQAYIFMFLTCLFLGQLVVHEHEPGPAHNPEHFPHAAGVHPQRMVNATAVHLAEPQH